MRFDQQKNSICPGSINHQWCLRVWACANDKTRLWMRWKQSTIYLFLLWKFNMTSPNHFRCFCVWLSTDVRILRVHSLPVDNSVEASKQWRNRPNSSSVVRAKIVATYNATEGRGLEESVKFHFRFYRRHCIVLHSLFIDLFADFLFFFPLLFFSDMR